VYEPGQRITQGRLYRRIFPHSAYYSNGKVTSQVFDSRGDDHLSMALADLTTPEELLIGHEGFGVLEIDAADLCAEGLEVEFSPSEQEGPAHVAVRGSLTRSVRKRLANRAAVVKPPNISQPSE